MTLQQFKIDGVERRLLADERRVYARAVDVSDDDEPFERVVLPEQFFIAVFAALRKALALVYARRCDMRAEKSDGVERRALREMAGLPVEEPQAPLRQNAQQVLLLAWLQEKQALEMAALEQKISDSRRALAGLFSGATRGRNATAAPDERDLPDWKRTLAAALAFAPDMPEGTTLVVASSAMADAVSELGAPDAPNAPAGYRAVRASVDQLAALCGRAPHDKLSRSLSADQRQRALTLFLPESSR